MNFSLGLTIGLLLGLSLSLVGYVLLLRRFIKRKLQEIEAIKETHRQAFEDLIDRVNHEGQIPIASTALGLTGLTLSAISRSIDSLIRLLEKQDWRTQSIISELQGIRGVELVLLYKKIEELIESIRQALQDYNHKQEHHDTNQQVFNPSGGNEEPDRSGSSDRQSAQR